MQYVYIYINTYRFHYLYLEKLQDITVCYNINISFAFPYDTID